MQDIFPKKYKLLLYSAIFLLITITLVWQVFEVSAQQTSLENSSELAEKIREINESHVFAEFDTWTEQYVDNGSTDDKALIKYGTTLAIKRKELLKELIKLDPKVALEKAIHIESDNLPSSVTKHFEKHVSGYGDFLVYVIDEIHHSTEKMAGSRIEREVVIDNSRYKAFVYGRRESMTTKLNIPIQGIVIDDTIVVDESFVQKIPPAENSNQEVETSKLNADGIAVELGGKIEYFSNQLDFDNFVNEQIEWESKIGPTRPSENVGSGELASSWTEGLKTVLFIRVDFPDRQGEPIDVSGVPLTEARVLNLMNNEVNPFYVNGSYNKTSQQVTVTPVVRLPQSQSFYTQGGGFQTLEEDARKAARVIGFETDNFNLEIIAFTRISAFSWAGMATLGGKGAMLNGYFSLRETAHELGHNYGLNHANLWRTTDGTVTGPGNNVEYGDCFDAMGGCYTTQSSHFNTHYKRLLNWLTDANVQTVTSDGVYRIFAQDLLSPDGIRTLKIRKNATKNYWIEFRQLFTNNPNAMSGAFVRWDNLNTSFRETQLLDMTPNTSTNVDDVPLLIGQSFHDSENRIRVTIIGKGNTTPESLDVGIELNVGCSFSLEQGSQTFSASGGGGIIPINTQSGCRTPAVTSDSWLYAAPTDTGAISYIVAANYGSEPRSGTITVAGQTFTVQQDAATTTCLAPQSGLVAWWRGEGNTLDQTGVNNGTLVNNMTFGGGKIGGGFKGDSGFGGGSAAIKVPDSSSLTLNRSMTFEGWLKADSFGGIVIEKRTTNFPSLGSYAISMAGNRLNFTLWGTNNSFTGINSPPLPLGQFFHFAVTLDDETGQGNMYINGSIAGQFTTALRPNAITDAEITVGRIKGITDELSVYNRALSDSEIQAIYNAGTASTGGAGKCLSTQQAATVGGRITSLSGKPMPKAKVTITDSNGVSRSVSTNRNGYYSFTDVSVGRTYTIIVAIRRKTFTPNTQTLYIDGNIDSIDFVSDN